MGGMWILVGRALELESRELVVGGVGRFGGGWGSGLGRGPRWISWLCVGGIKMRVPL